MSLHDRIKEARKNKGLTQTELGDLIGVAKTTITGYEKNREPTAAQLGAIADALDVDVTFLLQDEVREHRDNSASLWEMENIIKKYRALDTYGQDTVSAVLDCEFKRCEEAKQLAEAKEVEPAPIEYIRHYFTAAAAGYAAPIEGEDYEMIPRDKSVPAKADFSIDITGDSMEPYIHDGQRVYVQRGTDLMEFDVGIFYVDGDVYCKQWCIDYVGTMHLLSANPQREDANITVPRDSVRSVVCFGKVILPKKLPRPIYP